MKKEAKWLGNQVKADSICENEDTDAVKWTNNSRC
jgi:hypothetical protein